MSQSPISLMSQSEYARHREVHRSYITRLKQNGVLIMRDGKVDVHASDAILDDRPDFEPRQAPPSPARPPVPLTETSGQTGASFQQARIIDAVYRAKIRRLEFEVKTGRLIEVEPLKKKVSEEVRAFRDGVLGLPDRLSTVIAAERDGAKVRKLLYDELKREFDRLAEALGVAA